MKFDAKVKGGLAWAGLIVILAVPAADIIMGRFADVHIASFSDAELDQYEHLLDAIETDLLAWLTGVASVPAEHDTSMFRRVRDFHLKG